MPQRHRLTLRLVPFLISFALLLFSLPAWGQAQGGPFNSVGSTTSQIQIYQSQGGALLLTVYSDPKVRLDRQAVVKLYNKNTKDSVWQTTNDKSEASFGDLNVAQYGIEVSAVGYLTAHKDLNVTSAIVT